ncbi:hypothetical protein HLH34_15345 [Gluconacetobacter azotocaptans]|uniref:Uncharacterized protein n=1 Tax=Gluconacetobacter azotocaptans TaxID=142834 RepID=A0A7W4JUT3_9PROT|nr:hypothetical protein [Gluconacetobacter azotocaptans]MBB2191316.1 hypothetical protein [Gluconacetobacter azotocaptans]GBQ33283.1 hypothetical protein AA13594_2581 [Gluconacetobacter azotocaptans DSM 13594]
MTNYILYRTANDVVQPPPYTDPISGRTVTPPSFVADPAGRVILTQQIGDPSSVSVPAGFALAADPAGHYPVGSLYPVPA